jgi:hypothetical protein
LALGNTESIISFTCLEMNKWIAALYLMWKVCINVFN